MNPAHIDYDTLADLSEGLLEDDQAASVNAHLDTCAECRELSADLADVSRILAEAPVPSMPADLASRIDSALAAESLNSATVVSLEQRRGRRHWRILSVAAASVVVLGGGAIVGQSVLDNARNDGAATAHSPVTDSGEKNVSPKGAAPQAPGDANGDQRTLALKPTAFGVARSGTEYKEATLGQDVERLLNGKGKEALLEPHTPDVGMAECVGAVTKGRTPALVDSATFEGKPATVIVLDGTGQGGREVWVVGPNCSPQNLDVLKRATL